jgi:hypothetical protein
MMMLILVSLPCTGRSIRAAFPGGTEREIDAGFQTKTVRNIIIGLDSRPESLSAPWQVLTRSLSFFLNVAAATTRYGNHVTEIPVPVTAAGIVYSLHHVGFA